MVAHGPGPAAVYRFYDERGVLLYAGVTQDIGKRWNYHATQQLWWYRVARCTIELYGSWDEASHAEDIAIAIERPVYNAPPPGGRAAALHAMELIRMIEGGEMPRGNEMLTGILRNLSAALAWHLGGA